MYPNTNLPDAWLGKVATITHANSTTTEHVKLLGSCSSGIYVHMPYGVPTYHCWAWAGSITLEKESK